MRRMVFTQAALLALTAGLSGVGPASAMTAIMESSLKRMDPRTRLEQRCDIEAMDRIRRDTSRFNPDKVLAYAFGEPQYGENGMRTRGAAFRSGGTWLRLSYKCLTTPDHMAVTTFKYRIGPVVPRSEWDAHWLVP